MDQVNHINVKLEHQVFHIYKLWITLIKGHMLADVPAVLGSLDIVFGEVDR